MKRIIKNILLLTFTLLTISYVSYGLSSFYDKGELGIGYGFGIGKNFDIEEKMEFGMGIGHNISINLNKYGADLDFGLLYNLGFPFSQKGIASWYGKEDHGDLTASGEPYNMYEYTAAHRTLPFGTLVKVTNLKNGKSVVVRINDRGPFVRGRIIDLSYASARKIGMIKQGTALVSLEVIDVSGLSVVLGYDIGKYNGVFHIGGILEFPLVKNVSGIFELKFIPESSEFVYGGGVFINIYRPFKIKVGVDNILSSNSPNIFLEIFFKF